MESAPPQVENNDNDGDNEINVNIDTSNIVAVDEDTEKQANALNVVDQQDTTTKEPNKNNEVIGNEYKVNDKEPIAVATPEVGKNTGNPNNTSKKSLLLSFCALVVVIVIVVIAVVISGRTIYPPGPVPVAVDYSTGVSLITYYGINTTVSSRLSQTKITMEVANALDCSSIHSITLQLPLATNVVSLQTISNDDCSTNGEVMELQDARETFLETAAGGLPGAYVEAQDSFTYSIQVTMPPLGTTKVEVVFEQLLQQRLGEIEFQIPLVPNEQVDQIVVDLLVEDIYNKHKDTTVNDHNNNNNTNVTNLDFDLDFGMRFIPSKHLIQPGQFHLNLPDAREHMDLSKVLRGKYNASEIPDSGYIYTDGNCFEHFFRPSTLKPMKRNILFLVDTSTSAYWYDRELTKHKLRNIQLALEGFINKNLVPEDTFTIQTFGQQGTESLWGSAHATDEEKMDAVQFMNATFNGDEGRYYGSSANLHEALLEALLRSKSLAVRSKNGVTDNDTATILVVLSNNRANTGETNRTEIVKDIYKLNREGTVKIYTLGFDDGADTTLLRTISIMNGGATASIIRGDIDYSRQIEHFFESEFGTVLLSDVQVDFEIMGNNNNQEGGTIATYGETQRTFPLLANGYEIVVRGLIGQGDKHDNPLNLGSRFLRVVTKAATMDGVVEWDADAEAKTTNSEANTHENSLCFQSYAHSRIDQLLNLHDAAELISNDILAELVSLSNKTCIITEDLVDCIKQEALSLALRANIVAEGLTGMVTVDDEQCLQNIFNNTDSEICLDGTGTGMNSGYGYGYGYGNEGGVYKDAGGVATMASAPARSPMMALERDDAEDTAPVSYYSGSSGGSYYATSSASPFFNFFFVACACFTTLVITLF